MLKFFAIVLFVTHFCLGLRSALTPEEIRAAEAAEQLIDQERRDAELALRLQVRITFKSRDLDPFN